MTVTIEEGLDGKLFAVDERGVMHELSEFDIAANDVEVGEVIDVSEYF